MLIQKRFVDGVAEKQYFVDLQRRETAINLNGVTCMRRFDEDSRKILVWGGAIAPASGAMKIREKGWTRISKMEGKGKATSVVQTCYQVVADANSIADGDEMRQSVLNAWCQELRTDLLVIQNVVLNEAAKRGMMVPI